MDARRTIESGRAVLGIEFGSTRIKAVLVDEDHVPIAQGSYEWENQLVDGLWTYSKELIWFGLQQCYADLRADVRKQYDVEIERLGAIGLSAMMHGYMPFDEEGSLLVPFRTWRNTNTGPAAAELSKLFVYNIPLRWSISHLYQAILNGEEHVPQIAYFTTLAGYIHWKLTGEKVLGVGDASGMLPIDPATGNYRADMVEKFEKLVEPKGFPWKLRDILPKVLPAGAPAGRLTETGAKRLDISGHLQAGVPLCPPEGDAGTGMVATNAVRPRTGNVSAGTSSFSMIVVEKELSKPNEMIDMVTTPDGNLVAMVHCNNCTSELNAWVKMIREYQELLGPVKDTPGPRQGQARHLRHPLQARAGRRSRLRRPRGLQLRLRRARHRLRGGTPAVRAQRQRQLHARELHARAAVRFHRGAHPVVGQRFLAAALNSPISVMETAGEGGAWGIAILASFLVNNASGMTLPDFLDKVVFADLNATEIAPDPADVAGFNTWLAAYQAAFPIERAAIECKK